MLPRNQRLTRSADVRAVLRRGRRRAAPTVVVHALPAVSGGSGRVAVVASRTVGGAVERNRAKRVLRAAIAMVGVPDGLDIALVARRGTGAAGASGVAAALPSLLEDLAVASSGVGA